MVRIYSPFQLANLPGTPYTANPSTPGVYRSIAAQMTPQTTAPVTSDPTQQQQRSLTPIPEANPMRAALARQMMATGSAVTPVRSPLEGLARTLTGIAGGYFAGEANRAEQAREAARGERLASVLGLDPETAKGLTSEEMIATAELGQRREAAAMKAAQPRKFTATNFYNPDDPTQIITVTTPEEQARAIQAGLIKGNPPSGWTVETMPDGTTRVSMGRQGQSKGPLSSSTASKTEQAVMAAQDNLARINLVEQMFDPAYLTLGGMAKAKAQETLNRMGLSEGEFAADRGGFEQVSQQMFDAYRVAVTGAGAGPTELKMLGRSFPTMSDAPAVYTAKLRLLKDWNEYIVARGQAALEQGITPQAGNKEYREFVEQYKKDNPPPSFKPNVPETQEASAAGETPQTTAESTGGLMLSEQEIREMPVEDLRDVDPAIIPPNLLEFATRRLRGG